MKISWEISAIVFTVNLAYIALMYTLQALDTNLPARHSVIPGTNQKFLYMQDFWTMTYGDALGVSLIAVAFVHLTTGGHVNPGQWIVFAVFAIVSVTIFTLICLGSEHKPDMGFPQIGKISWLGILHLPYFGAGVAISAFCIWHLIMGNLRGPVMWVAICGGAIYVACFIAEIASGNLDPLKKV